jgi:hypothetical protein
VLIEAAARGIPVIIFNAAIFQQIIGAVPLKKEALPEMKFAETSVADSRRVRDAIYCMSNWGIPIDKNTATISSIQHNNVEGLVTRNRIQIFISVIRIRFSLTKRLIMNPFFSTPKVLLQILSIFMSKRLTKLFLRQFLLIIRKRCRSISSQIYTFTDDRVTDLLFPG